MANTSNCLQLIDRMPQQDQDALLARLDALQAKGLSPKEAQLQAAIDVLAQVEREGQARKSQPRLSEDIPNDEWLQGKIDYAMSKGRNQWGVPHMSTVTGYFDKPVEVSLRVLSRLKGERNEQNNVREDSLEYIRKNWDKVSQQPPYIEVAYNGEAWVSEGNHRIMVAAENGLESMPVEIRYFDGGQRRNGPLKPSRIPSLEDGSIRKSADREANFERWTRGLPVIEADFSGTYDGGPAVFQAYHGTTHDDITEFKNIGSKEGALGQGPYFSTSVSDVNENYAGVGPDLTSRIGREIDNVAQGFDDDAWYATDVLQAYFDDNGIDTEITDDNIEELKDEHREKAIEHAATKALKGDSDGLVMPVYVRLEKPFNMASSPTYFEMTYPVDENGEPDYEAEPEGSAVDLINAINEVASGYYADVDSFTGWVYENGSDGISAREVWDRASKDINDLYDDNGDMISSGQFMQEVAREMGFDGLIQDADLYFGTQRRGFGGIRAGAMKGVEPGTLHIMPFDGAQVKSATGNNGEFGENREILKSVDRPQFYSQLQRAIEGVPDRIANMAAPQWKLWLDSNGPKQGVKKDEIEWSGIKDYLDLQGKAKLSKDDLARYLDDSGVKVSETMMGGGGYDETQMLENISQELFNNGYWDISASQQDRVVEVLDQRFANAGPATKYGKYTLPGGENYRELLITLPTGIPDAVPAGMSDAAYVRLRGEKAKSVFQSSHWDEKNVLAHIRINDRTAQEPGYVVRNTRSGNPSEVFATREQAEAFQAKLPASVKTEIIEQPRDVRVLFVEELQSDWGQAGKKKGFADGAEVNRLRAELKAARAAEADALSDALAANDSNSDAANEALKAAEQKTKDIARAVDAETRRTASMAPVAPFITKTEGWLNLALKRIAMLAVEGGYDKVAFVNGEQSADRYDLSKRISRVVYSPTTETLNAFDSSGESVMMRSGVTPEQVEDYIGKEPAKRLLDPQNTKTERRGGKDVAYHEIAGEDLRVGGEGMKTFYDQIVPQTLNKLLPKIGGVKSAPISFGKAEWVVRDSDGDILAEGFSFEEDAKRYAADYRGATATNEGGPGDQPGFDVTDKMRETVNQGVPLFSRDRFVQADKSELYQKRTAKDVGLISDKDAMAALETDATSVRIMDKGYQVKPGELVGARLNLNVLKNTKVPVMTLHKATNAEGYKKNRGFYRGEAVQYKPAVTLRNAYFNVDQTGRENIATGVQNKFPMASVDGEFVDAKPNFDGVEVSFNPMRVHLFVDAKGRPVRSAEEISMFGTRAYARGKIEYYTEDTAPIRKGEAESAVKFSRDRAQTRTPQFKSWFGDSKVVDADGNPMVVYTGTSKDVDFKSFKIPKNGAWFTYDPYTASAYALENDSMAIKTQDYRTFTNVNTASRVMPVYLRIEKMYTPTESEMTAMIRASNYKREQGNLFDRVRREGFDGVDMGNGVYVVIGDATQIKSAIGNDGGFDPSKKDITKSRDRKAPDTKEFKAWFGDSKVVNADGSPKVVYRGEHGEDNGRMQTKLGSITFGSYEVASEYAMEPNDSRMEAVAPRVTPAYLSIQKPIFLEEGGDPFVDVATLIDALGQKTAMKFVRKHEERLGEGAWEDDETLGSLDEIEADTPEKLKNLYILAYPLLDDPEFVAAAKAAGYDGAIHGGSGISSDTEYRVFDETQIKSATGNSGAFSRETSDITKSADRTNTAAFKKWFGDSQTVDANGEPIVFYRGQSASYNDSPLDNRYFTRNPAYASTYDDDEDVNVLPVYIKAENVYMPDDANKVTDYMFDRDALLKQGYDAIATEGFDVIVALKGASQIKSATGNNGEFDAANSDILKSPARPYFDDLAKLKVSTNYQLGDLFKTSRKLSWWDRTIGTQYNLAQKYPEFKRVFDAVQRFINDVSAFATRAADMAPSILPKLETLKDITKSPLSAADVQALRDPVFGGTLKYMRDEEGNIVETDDVQKAGVVFTDEELRGNFNLNDRQIGLYREFRKAVDQSVTDLALSDMVRYLGEDGSDIAEAVMASGNVDVAVGVIESHLADLANATPQRAEVLNNALEAIKQKGDQANSLMDRGYAPLSRFGQYTVYVVGQNGEQEYFGMFENQRDANKMAREMTEQYPESTVSTGTMSQESYKLFSGVTPETLALFGESLGLEESGIDTKSEAYQQMLKVAKTNRSAMKRLIQRKGIDGFSEDAGRVLAGFVYSNARQVATNLHAGEIGKSAAAVKDGDVKDAAIRLMEYIQNPQEEAQAIRGLMFTQFIGGSIASAIVNLTQPFTMTMPYLSQFGGATGAGKAMADALKLASRGIRNDEDLQQMLKRAEDEGVVSPQEVHQLMAQAQGKGSLQSGDGTKAGDALAKANNFKAKVSLGWGKLFGAAEQFNRRVTFIAAYKLAREQGMENPYEFATQTIAETQGVYNKGNKPTWARGAVGGTVFTFKQYSISYLEFLRRMWGNGPEGKKAVGLALGVLFLMSGAGGLPGADDLDDVIDGFAQRVLGRSFDSKQAKREFFASILGQSGAEFVMSGISGLPGMPIDVSGRMGLGNFIPGTGLMTKKRDYTNDLKEIAGPAATLATNAGTFVAKLAGGEPWEASKALAPVAAQNVLKAADMAAMGFYRDQKGRKVVDTDMFDVVAKGMGFQPRAVAQVQEATGTQANLIAQNKLRETEIADKWAAGRIERDPAKVQAAQRMLADWNEKNPDSKILISAAQINKRVQEANKSKAQRVAATAPKEIRGAVRKELQPFD